MQKRTRARDAYLSAFEVRARTVRALADVAEGKPVEHSRLASLGRSMQEVGGAFGTEPAGLEYVFYGGLVSCVGLLLQWANGMREAEVDSGRHRKAALLRARELKRDLTAKGSLEPLGVLAEELASIGEDTDQISVIARALVMVPLSVPLFSMEAPRASSDAPREAGGATAPPAVLFVQLHTGGTAIASPLTLEPGVVDIDLEASINVWPLGVDKIVLRPLSVEEESYVVFPTFTLMRPAGDPPHRVPATGRLLLRASQDAYSYPMEASYGNARCEPETSQAIIVEGATRLTVRSHDYERAPLTGHPLADKAIVSVADQARLVPGISRPELQKFLRVLKGLGQIAGDALEDASFVGDWDEKRFQQRVVELVRRDTQLAAWLEIHPHVAGGITDISFEKIRVELKVENATPVTLEYCERYLAQSSQYVAGSSRLFGGLCVLDMCPKTTAPGPVSNDIALLSKEPPTGGVQRIQVGVVIVRGNMPRPSSTR